jgi:hypothetical protein
VDPASGTDAAGNGAERGRTPLVSAALRTTWHCVAARVRLNDPGLSNGVFELWVDGSLDAGRSGLSWVGSFGAYGMNAVMLENYWNAGSPVMQERYLDNFVVSTSRIGCG